MPNYTLHFLTDEWVWEESLAAVPRAQAVAQAREALERVVREEAPGLACVTLAENGRKLGVWDWVSDRSVWTPEG